MVIPGWGEAYDILRASRCEKVPEGWKTAPQIAEEVGLDAATISTRLIKPLILAGKAESRKFFITTTQNGVKRIVHYRLLQGSRP